MRGARDRWTEKKIYATRFRHLQHRWPAAAESAPVIGWTVAGQLSRATPECGSRVKGDVVDSPNKDLSREEREHQQCRDAYIPMMEYVAWAKRVNLVRTELAVRRDTAVGEVRPYKIEDMTPEAAAAMRAAFDNNGPTE